MSKARSNSPEDGTWVRAEIWSHPEDCKVGKTLHPDRVRSVQPVGSPGVKYQSPVHICLVRE
nr:hypothetical protein Itr_chr04CG09630 [Ipomoea trifida]